MNKVRKFCDVLEKACLLLAMFLLVAVTALTFIETVMRYAFHSSLVYTQELVTYSMPWIAFVGGAVAWRRGALVNIDVLGKAPRGIKVAATLVCQLLIIALLAFTVKSGIRYVNKNLHQLSSAMQVSVSWCYAAIPVGCAMMTVFSVEKVLNVLFTGKEENK